MLEQTYDFPLKLISQGQLANASTRAHNIQEINKSMIKKTCLPTVLRRLTPTLCACTEPPIVTQGTPMYSDSHVVVVPA